MTRLAENAKTKTTLRALVSLGLLAAIILHVDWNEIAAVAASVALWPVALSIAFNVIGVALSVLKWQWFLDLHQIHFAFVRLHLLYYVGFFFSNFLPSTIGGDVLRVLNTGTGGRHAEAFAAVMGERGTGFGVMLALAGTAGLINLQRDVPVGLDWLAIILLIACAGALAVAALAVALRQRQSGSKWARRVTEVVDAVLVSLRSPATLARALLVSGLFHMLFIANAYLFCYAIGLRLDPLALAVVFPVAMLAAMLPVSINGIGVQEGALVVLLGQLGVTTEQALFVAVLARLFVIVASLAGGAIFALNSSVRLTLVRKAAANALNVHEVKES